MFFANQHGIQFQKLPETPMRLPFVNSAGENQVSRVMIPLALDETGVKIRQSRIQIPDASRQNLEFLTTAPLHERENNEMINNLLTAAFAYGGHHSANPRTTNRLTEGNAALPQKREHLVEMLEFLNRNGIQLLHVIIQFLEFLKVKRGGRRLALKVSVIHENLMKPRPDIGKPGIG